MKNRITTFLFAVSLSAAFNAQVSAQGTVFTYQGRLADNGAPATGTYDLQFSLRDAAAAGNAVGATNTIVLVSVSNGLFTVMLDFGNGVFDGSARWLEMRVRTHDAIAAYSVLSPRQILTSTPYAVRAANFGGAVSDSQLSSNVARLNANQTFSGTVNFSGASNSYTGSFTDSGGALSNLNLTLNSAGGIRFAPSGFFLLAGLFAVGNSATSVRATDVNGDGHVDLINANINSHNLSVLTLGGFVLASTPDAGISANSVAVADVDGDGCPDLACASGGVIVVLRNSLAQFHGVFVGDGATLTGFNADNISNGTLADARLSTNVALLNANQTVTGQHNFMATSERKEETEL